tara:strand:- start:6308 stop:6835 length:528 start_codon:yes stop_codon:yes gene_type:complete
MKTIIFALIISVLLMPKNEVLMEYENSLEYLWGNNYTIHRIDSVQNYEIINSQYFTDVFILNSFLTHFGQDTTSFTDNFRDTVNVENLSNYLSGYGSRYEIGLDTIYKDFWNSHGTICASANIPFIDANSTKWDELTGVSSNPLPHKSFTIMIPLSGGGNEIVYYFINKSNPPSY